MGEYAIFIWPCYLAVVVVMGVLGYSSWKNKRSDEKKLMALNARLENIQKQD